MSGQSYILDVPRRATASRALSKHPKTLSYVKNHPLLYTIQL